MNGSKHEKCYGAMFPDTMHAGSDRPQKGKVFSFTLLSAGGLFRAGRTAEVNQAAWDECVQCPEFENCYKLSMAKVALETAIAGK